MVPSISSSRMHDLQCTRLNHERMSVMFTGVGKFRIASRIYFKKPNTVVGNLKPCELNHVLGKHKLGWVIPFSPHMVSQLMDCRKLSDIESAHNRDSSTHLVFRGRHYFIVSPCVTITRSGVCFEGYTVMVSTPKCDKRS